MFKLRNIVFILKLTFISGSLSQFIEVLSTRAQQQGMQEAANLTTAGLLHSPTEKHNGHELIIDEDDFDEPGYFFS